MTKELAGLALHGRIEFRKTHHLDQLQLQALGIEVSELLGGVGLSGVESRHGRRCVEVKSELRPG